MTGPHPSSGLGCTACREVSEPGGRAPGEPVTPIQGPDTGSPCTEVPVSSALSGPHQSPPPPGECRGTSGRENTELG